MEGGGGIFLDSDSEPCGAVAGQKAKRGKVVKGDSVSVGTSQKKTLADITNLQQQQQQLNQQSKQQNAPLATPDISADMLLKENAMLMKLLANRNAVIESCKAELQKCQSNFQKLRKQNSELALTNSQMLTELNSSRQRRRELEHELGSKNGILKAMKLELAAKEHTVKLKNDTDANEVGTYQSKQSDQSLQEDNRGDAKRKRVSKSKSSAPAVTRQLKSTEKVANQRYSLRRQSAGMKTEKPEPTKDFFEVDDVSHLQENMANENGATSSGSKVHEEAREDTECSGPANTEQVHVKKNIEKKRHSLRRQSSKFRPENPELTEDWQSDKLRPENPEPTKDWQSDKLRPENPEPTKDFFKIDDAKFSISHLCDNMSEKNHPIMSRITSGQENNACTFEPQELRRSSVGRPLRRTVEKVASYKEVPLNVKMRRPN